MAQYFTLSDYSMSLPVILLTLFALGILLMDLMIPAEWKWFNALTAFIGVLFSAAAVYFRIQRPLDAAGLPAQTAFMNAMLLDHFAVLWTNGQHESDCYSKPPRAGDGAPKPCQSNRGDRTADDGDRLAFQNRRYSISSMGARCLRRRADQHDGIYVGRGEGGRLGHAAADFGLGTFAFASGLRSAACICLGCNHDRSELRGAHPNESQTTAGLFV